MKKIVLLRMELTGVKNIQKKVHIDFSSIYKTKSIIDITNSNVKAIYGQNGAGKTALLSSVFLYKKLTTFPAYLSVLDNKLFVSNLINKKTKTLEMKFYFAVLDDGENYLFSHEIVLNNNQGVPVISSERIKKYIDNSISGESKTILELENGTLTICGAYNDDILDEMVIDALKNNIGMSSVLSFAYNPIYPIKLKDIVSTMPKELLNQEVSEFLCAVVYSLSFVYSISVYLDIKDQHIGITRPWLCQLINKCTNIENDDSRNFDFNVDVIPKEEFSKYLEYIDRLSKFIKIFKPELLKIDVKKKIENKSYHVYKEFCYKDYKVDEEYESSGIKHLIEIYNYLNAASKGEIVFIDEMDINLNSVHLLKLVDYFKKYGKGQLVFTTHNLIVMSSLKSMKNSINFITLDGDVTEWIKNGNYSPDSQYIKGMVKGLPFNVDDFDFLGCFENEE